MIMITRHKEIRNQTRYVMFIFTFTQLKISLTQVHVKRKYSLHHFTLQDVNIKTENIWAPQYKNLAVILANEDA